MLNKTQILEQTHASIIIAISDTEIGKVVLPSQVVFVGMNTGEIFEPFEGKDKPSLSREIESMQYANAINDLLPKFIRKDTWKNEEGTQHDMIVMERLYPLSIHHFDLEIRKVMMRKFELEMKELHDNDFVHGDFCRPTNYFTRGNREWMYKNIVQTEMGLRLIDAGFSRFFKRDNNARMFASILVEERNDIPYFSAYYLDEN